MTYRELVHQILSSRKLDLDSEVMVFEEGDGRPLTSIKSVEPIPELYNEARRQNALLSST